MPRSAKKPPKHQDKTKDRIVSAAIKLFAKHGYDGTSTKAICQAARANIAALHYYFETKEKLYLSIIQEFGKESLDSALRTLSEPYDPGEIKVRLEMFLHETLERCFKNLDLVTLVLNEGESSHPRSHDVFNSTFDRMCEELISFFATASKRKWLARGIDPELAADAVFAQLSQAIRTEPVKERFRRPSLKEMNYRKKWVHAVVHILLEGVLPRSL